jgi:hypothetical protein
MAAAGIIRHFFKLKLRHSNFNTCIHSFKSINNNYNQAISQCHRFLSSPSAAAANNEEKNSEAALIKQFLTNFKCAELAEKFPSWNDLIQTNGRKLKGMEIKIVQRKLILKAVEDYKQRQRLVRCREAIEEELNHPKLSPEQLQEKLYSILYEHVIADTLRRVKFTELKQLHNERKFLIDQNHHDHHNDFMGLFHGKAMAALKDPAELYKIDIKHVKQLAKDEEEDRKRMKQFEQQYEQHEEDDFDEEERFQELQLNKENEMKGDELLDEGVEAGSKERRGVGRAGPSEAAEEHDFKNILRQVGELEVTEEDAEPKKE